MATRHYPHYRALENATAHNYHFWKKLNTEYIFYAKLYILLNCSLLKKINLSRYFIYNGFLQHIY